MRQIYYSKASILLFYPVNLNQPGKSFEQIDGSISHHFNNQCAQSAVSSTELHDCGYLF